MKADISTSSTRTDSRVFWPYKPDGVSHFDGSPLFFKVNGSGAPKGPIRWNRVRVLSKTC